MVLVKSNLKIMPPELLAWLSNIPKGYSLASFKEKDYRGTEQLALYIAKPQGLPKVYHSTL